MSGKNPYTLALAGQLAEIPFQLAHHLRASKPLTRPEKHWFGSRWRQYSLLWLPPEGAAQRNSVVVLYHGGGWRVGWPGLHPTIAEFFLREGFPVIMPAYRLAPFAWHKQMREDLNLALVKTLNLLKEKNLEGKKLLVGGMSAGALAGPLDLDQMPDFRAVRNYAGGKPGTAVFQAANPVNYLEGDENIPALLIHGTGDAIVPFACSQSFFEKYAGEKQLHPLPRKTHLDVIRFATDDYAAAEVLKSWLEDK
jgi:dipeptidyl aminopeptidase/acylaminoacyl peptidase